MSIEAWAWAVKQDLPAMQKMVLVILANRVNPALGYCYPSQTRLAKDSGMTPRSVENQVKKLEEQGFIKVIRKSKNNLKQANKYYLLMNEEKVEKDIELIPKEVRDYLETIPKEIRDYLGIIPKEIRGNTLRDSVLIPKEIRVNTESLSDKTVRETINKPIYILGEKFNWEKTELPDYVNREIWEEWNQERIKKKASVSKSVLQKNLQELEKIHEAGADVTAAMIKGMSWAGFDASWILNNQPGINNATNKQTFTQNGGKPTPAEQIANAAGHGFEN